MSSCPQPESASNLFTFNFVPFSIKVVSNLLFQVGSCSLTGLGDALAA